MTDRTEFPRSLIVVAALFVLTGLWSVVNMWGELMRHSLHLDFGVLGLLIGPGLLNRKRGWRTVAMVFIWFRLIVGPLAALLIIGSGGKGEVQLLGQTVNGIPVATVWALLVGLYALVIWQYRVMTAPGIRALFDEDGFEASRLQDIRCPRGAHLAVWAFGIGFTCVATWTAQSYVNEYSARAVHAKLDQRFESGDTDDPSIRESVRWLLTVAAGKPYLERLSQDHDTFAYHYVRSAAYFLTADGEGERDLETVITGREGGAVLANVGITSQVVMESVQMDRGILILRCSTSSKESDRLALENLIGLEPGRLYEVRFTFPRGTSEPIDPSCYEEYVLVGDAE